MLPVPFNGEQRLPPVRHVYENESPLVQPSSGHSTSPVQSSEFTDDKGCAVTQPAYEHGNCRICVISIYKWIRVIN